MKRAISSILSDPDPSLESSSNRILSPEEKIISLNRNFSLVESQPSDHFRVISQFLSHIETIQFFRSSHRLYSIPLQIPIFLNYYNESRFWKKYFEMKVFHEIISTSTASESESECARFTTSFRYTKLFRFFISSITISTNEDFLFWKNLISSKYENFKLFSKLNELELNL